MEDYVKFLLNLVSGVLQGTFIQLGSTLNGLIGGLAKGLSDGDGLIGTVVGGVKGAFDDLSIGVFSANFNNLRGIL